MGEPTPSETPPGAAVPSPRNPIPQFGQYLLVGLTGVVVNLIVFSLVLGLWTGDLSFDLLTDLTHSTSETGVSVAATLTASVIAFAIATLWNFVLNNLWTFRTERGHYHPVRRRVALYYLVSLASLGVNEVVLYALLSVLPPLYGQAIGIAAGSIVGFVGNRRITFVEPAPTTAG